MSFQARGRSKEKESYVSYFYEIFHGSMDNRKLILTVSATTTANARGDLAAMQMP
jgi:hypothetical protein